MKCPQYIPIPEVQFKNRSKRSSRLSFRGIFFVLLFFWLNSPHRVATLSVLAEGVKAQNSLKVVSEFGDCYKFPSSSVFKGILARNSGSETSRATLSALPACQIALVVARCHNESFDSQGDLVHRSCQGGLYRDIAQKRPLIGSLRRDLVNKPLANRSRKESLYT